MNALNNELFIENVMHVRNYLALRSALFIREDLEGLFYTVFGLLQWIECVQRNQDHCNV